jgi:hypothetical protein
MEKLEEAEYIEELRVNVIAKAVSKLMEGK